MEDLRRAGWAGSLQAPSLSEGAAPQAAKEGAGSGMWSFCRGSAPRPAGWLFLLGLTHGYFILPTGKTLGLKQSEEQEKTRGAPCPQLTHHPGRWFHALLASWRLGGGPVWCPPPSILSISTDTQGGASRGYRLHLSPSALPTPPVLLWMGNQGMLLSLWGCWATQKAQLNPKCQGEQGKGLETGSKAPYGGSGSTFNHRGLECSRELSMHRFWDTWAEQTLTLSSTTFTFPGSWAVLPSQLEPITPCPSSLAPWMQWHHLGSLTQPAPVSA